MAKHPELTGNLLHLPGYVQDADPGVVGPGMLWVDTSGGVGLYQVKIRNETDDGWEPISVGGLTDHTLLSNIGVYTHPQIDIHINDTTNPHAVTAAQAGAAEEAHDHTSMIHIDVAGEFSAAAEKFSLNINDKLLLEDAQDAENKKFVRISNLPGGASTFAALTDTPAAYAGQAGKVVAVNGLEDALEFIAAGGGGAYLPLAGGIMAGNIDFSDLGEGIRFWDEDSAYFKGLYFDFSGDPEIRIGDNAAPFGGPPIVHANTPVFRIGYDSIGGFAALEMWNENFGGYETIITSISDFPGDPLEFGTGDHALLLNGSETRPVYNGGDLALFSDIPPGGGEPALNIPHSTPWDGNEINATLHGIHTTFAPPGDVNIYPGDLIRAFHHGSATPTFNPPRVRISKDGGAPVPTWTAWSQNVWSVPINFDVNVDGPGQFIIWMEVDDGTFTMPLICFAVIDDLLGLGGGGP